MKKFGKVFGVTALAVATISAGAIGLSGCGDKTSLADVEKYVVSETTENLMPSGFKYSLTMNGMVTTGEFVFRDENKMEMGLVVSVPADVIENIEASYSETYIKGDYVYMRTSKEEKYTRIEANFDDVTSQAAQLYAEYHGMADVKDTIKQLVSSFKEAEGKGLKVTKKEKNGELQFNLSIKDLSGNVNLKLVYKNDKISKIYTSTVSEMLGVNMVMSFEVFDGEVTFPEDLETNFEEETEVVPPEELEEAV